MASIALNSLLVPRLISEKPIVLFFALLFLMSCSSGGNESAVMDSNNHRLEASACWLDALDTLGAACGRLRVPALYDANEDPNTVERRVGYAVIPAAKPDNAALPLVYLQGGPGPSATLRAADFLPGNPAAFLREQRAVILIDYRGVGWSTPALQCEPPTDLASVQLCADAIRSEGVSLEEIRTAVFARDVDLLLEALNHERAFLVGFSYGTKVALTMARDRPQRIVGMVLDGVFPPEVNGITQSAQAALANLNYTIEQCEGNAPCRARFGDLRLILEQLAAAISEPNLAGDTLSLLAQLNRHPAAPLLSYELSHLGDNDIRTIVAAITQRLDGPGFADGDPAAEPAADPLIPEDIAHLAESVALNLAINCAEEGLFIEEQSFDADAYGFSAQVVSQLFDPAMSDGFQFACQAFEPRADAAELEPITSSIPTLLLSGGGDTSTATEWGDLVGAGLSRSTHIVIPLSGHITVGSSGCARALVSQFLSDPETILDRSCVLELENQAFPKQLVMESDNIIDEF